MAHNYNLDPMALSSIHQTNRNHVTTTDLYKPINTLRVVAALADYGWLPVASNQSKVRKGNEFREGYQKHAIKLENNTYRDVLKGLAMPQMLLRHSHDGTSSLQMLAALKIFLCSNGVISFSDALDIVRVLHKGFTEEKLEYAIKEFTRRVPLLTNEVGQMIATPIDRQESMLLAQSAIELRFEPLLGVDGNTIPLTGSYKSLHSLEGIVDIAYPITPAQLLTKRRGADTTNNLWGAFNVIQENIIERPVAKATSLNPLTGRTRKTRIRPVIGIDANTKLNQGLWAMAAKFAALKNGTANQPQLM